MRTKDGGQVGQTGGMASVSSFRDSSFSDSSFQWFFPLPRPHTGIPLGNGTQGVLVWGEDVLCFTVAHAGFWDRRAGRPFANRATFSQVRALLEAGDEAGIRDLFAENRETGVPNRPQQIGGGRLELRFPDGSKPIEGRLHFATATLEITLQNPQGAQRTLQIRQHSDACVCWVEGAADAQITVRPSWEWVGEKLASWGYEPPEELEIEDGGGFVQDVPENEALSLVWRRRNGQILISTALGDDVEAAAKQAVSLARALPPTDSRFFWEDYWRSVPKISLPDPELQRFWELALYKQAGMTAPQGVAATLQGPWMEEYQLPPWSNDYHFNINVQLIYYPALMTNQLEHFAPLWAMIERWMPKLRAAGQSFFERESALMLPHAVDDECNVVGSFWTGTIDHACTAWVAQMAWLHYRYSLDESVLREIAWPLLKGAFEGFWAMSEEREGKLSLPMSVSPEYRGLAMNAWGRDASFQLAAWHAVTQILEEAAPILGEKSDPRWREIGEKLPPYSTVEVPKNPWDTRESRPHRIALWEGLELEESHRHHSHLAAIWPFCSIDPLSPAHFETVRHSIGFWARQGAGNWTGWCLPWASILCARLDLPDAALAWLRWLDNYCNLGYGSRHNADMDGIASFGNSELGRRETGSKEAEVMQMDATMGFLVAICELLVQNRRDSTGQKAIHILPRLPRRWRELEFDGIRCEGAFLVGAEVSHAKIQKVRIQSERGGLLRLFHGLGETFLVNGESATGDLLEKQMSAGETLVLQRL